MLDQIQLYSGTRITPPPKDLAYHEFYGDDLRPRAHYLPMWDQLRQAGQELLDAKSRAAHRTLHLHGAPDPLYPGRAPGAGRDRPFDIVPRIITAGEWRTIEAGLKQRVRALNLFLADIYGRQDVLKDGVVPAELIYNGKDFRREIMDVSPPRDLYLHVSAVDLVRDEEGRYLVLEDNLRRPAGVSSMIENRVVERRVLPELFARYRVRRVEHYPELLLRALRCLSPRGEDRATIVLLTPGIFDSSFFEHGFLAREMGVELAEGRDLVCKNDKVYLKTPSGLRQVDVVYRRVPDQLLDPMAFDGESALGVAGILGAWRAGNVAIANAPGTGIADDKAVYAHVPNIIRYYLGETPVLENVPTYQMTDCQDQAYVLDNLERMVVKAVAESGGYEMLMGPASTPAQRSELERKIRDDPRNYVAHPVVQLSRHLCCLDGELASRHLDLRPFVVYGRDIEVLPGGLTRVAMTEGSLVVDRSRGGGSKDTWVLVD